MSTGRKWDIKFAQSGTKDKDGKYGFCVHIPTVISHSLKDRGFTRCYLEIVEDGLLLTPHSDENGTSGEKLELPW